MPSGCIFNVEAPSFYSENQQDILTGLGFSNSTTFSLLFSFVNQTMHYMAGDVAKIPYRMLGDINRDIISRLVTSYIDISRRDYDSVETSWDFKRHPLL